MKKKILLAIGVFLILTMSLSTFAFARPWGEKNNEKFLDYDVAIGFDFTNALEAIANPEYVPSEDKPNKHIITWVEQATTAYTISIEGIGIYTCGTDFEYSGVAVYTTIGEIIGTGSLGLPIGSKQSKFRVDYMYDFDAIPGGIEGTLQMLAVTAEDGVMWITSQSGTGDLRNVKVIATAGGAGHDGIVMGWPTP